ncbi:MAG: DUF3592 domain-containing protein, partial [Kiritimatiellaeota bacterium]|nr:DUF3592 domain-containing protein [Kiritimatiellota bacterium]
MKNKRAFVDEMLFSLLFGVYMLVAAAGSYSTHFKPLLRLNRARAWQETPAEITSLEYHGLLFTIFTIRYEYEIDGATHASERVSPFDETSMTDSYYREKYEHFKSHFDAQTPVVCKVDPDDPTYAILDFDSLAVMPSIPAKMIFHLLGGIYCLMFVVN